MTTDINGAVNVTVKQMLSYTHSRLSHMRVYKHWIQCTLYMPNAQMKEKDFYCSVSITILLIQFLNIYKQNLLMFSCAFLGKWPQRIYYSSILDSI